MEKSGIVCTFFYGLLIIPSTKEVHFYFFSFSARMRNPLEKIIQSQYENGMPPPIFSLVVFRLVKGNAEFFSEKSSNSKVEGRVILAENIFSKVTSYRFRFCLFPKKLITPAVKNYAAVFK